ncbi:cupin domain-containing protein [Streptomyces sp. NPDC020965]|uniref:AraC family transcriptional regulator n=1 Tax=Streptomyces sp. NPDC020965 TaxID=3365105 RepID=UPI0037B913D9
MDAFAGLLDGPRARGAFLLRMVMEPPWAVRVEDRAPLALMCLTEGEAWIIPGGPDGPDGAGGGGGPASAGGGAGSPGAPDGAGGGKPVLMRPGDVAIVRGPAPYTLADSPGTEPLAVAGPGGTCHDLGGAPLMQSMLMGVRTWGNDPDGSAVMQIGTYQMEGEISGRLLEVLPELIHLPAGAWHCPLLPIIGDELGRDEPGQSAMLDRMLDLLLISALRAWFARPEARAPAWYLAMGDPVVGRALRLIQDDPARPWTVAALATECGVSRAQLARRFHELVGEPPMAYLTRWRLDLAADLLRGSDSTVDAVARKVGYSGSFALSAAFKRVRGISPQEHRTGRRSGATLPERQPSLL